MIGDFKGGDEVLLSQALEAFDTLTNTTTEYRAALEGKSTGTPAAGSSAAGGVPNLQPPSSNPFQVTVALLHLQIGHKYCYAGRLDMSATVHRKVSGIELTKSKSAVSENRTMT